MLRHAADHHHIFCVYERSVANTLQDGECYTLRCQKMHERTVLGCAAGETALRLARRALARGLGRAPREAHHAISSDSPSCDRDRGWGGSAQTRAGAASGQTRLAGAHVGAAQGLRALAET